MTRAEQDQEYVLGTKQLLSAFFVVVALLGVFFTAGYIIGRNTGPKATTSSDASANSSPGAQAAERTASRGAEPVTEPPASEITPPPSAPASTAKPKVIDPVQASEAKPTPKPPAEAKPAPAPEVVNAVTSQVGSGHMYLQLMAVKRPVADNMVKLLKGRGYPALLGESSKPELFRVLVGPFTDMASLAKTKSGLKSAGFESVIAK
jgi:cell division septation protein DedD